MRGVVSLSVCLSVCLSIRSSFFVSLFFLSTPTAMFVVVFFPSVFIPSSIIIIKSLHCYCGVERWGLSAASQLVEQDKEWNGSFPPPLLRLLFFSFFFSRHLVSHEEQLFFAEWARHKRGIWARPLLFSLSLSLWRLVEQPNNFSFHWERKWREPTPTRHASVLYQ